MRQFKFTNLLGLLLALLLGMPAFAGDMAADTNYKGWGLNSEYNQHYKLSEYDRFKGEIREIVEIVPMEGMHPGVGIRVLDRDGYMVLVHLGPRGFLNPDNLGLREGDQVKVKGVWAMIGGNEVFMASKVKRGEYDEVKVRRTSNGKPFWVMTEAQREKHSN
ncbi:MAG: hypothetical protein ACLFOY_13615 [Desulfatibacillaceae bacterium]